MVLVFAGTNVSVGGSLTGWNASKSFYKKKKERKKERQREREREREKEKEKGKKKKKRERRVRRVNFVGTTLILYERFRQTDHSNKRGRIKFGRVVFAGTRPQPYEDVVACAPRYAIRRRTCTTNHSKRGRSVVAFVLHFIDGL